LPDLISLQTGEQTVSLYYLTVDMHFFLFSSIGFALPPRLRLGPSHPVNLHAIKTTRVCSLVVCKSQRLYHDIVSLPESTFFLI